MKHPRQESEPVLILTDEDYRRAFVEEPPAAAPPSPPAKEPERRRRRGWTALLCAVILAGGGAAAVLLRRDPPPPAPPAPVVVRAPRPAPKPVPPAPKVERAAPPAPPPVPPPPEEPEEDPKSVVEPVRETKRVPWNGGRGWIQVRLRMEHRQQVQETHHRATILWDGTRYVVERPDSGPAELWMERLELLLNLPLEDESWVRQTTRTGKEVLHVQSGDLQCRLVEGEDRFPQGIRRFRYWYAEEFPAGAIQAQLTFRDMTLHCRILSFGESAAPARKP